MFHVLNGIFPLVKLYETSTSLSVHTMTSYYLSLILQYISELIQHLEFFLWALKLDFLLLPSHYHYHIAMGRRRGREGGRWRRGRERKEKEGEKRRKRGKGSAAKAGEVDEEEIVAGCIGGGGRKEREE